MKTNRSGTALNSRMALIGCGAIAESYYLPALSRHPALLKEMILVDRNPSRLELLAQKYPVRSVSQDYGDILNEIDAAVIALPTALHAPVGMALLSRGIPILCEKPLAENGTAARAMIQAGKDSGALLAVNYLQRVVPHFAKVKEWLERRTWGRPLYLDYVVGEIFNWPTVSGFYFREDLSSRGILRDRGAHAVDHICWWLDGKPDILSSLNDSFGGSEAVASVSFARNGCKGQLSMSWFADVPCRFLIHCEDATIEGNIYDYQHLKIIRQGESKLLSLDSPLLSKIDVAEKILMNFVSAVQGQEALLISGEDVLDSIDCIDECYRVAQPFHMPWYEFVEKQNVR